MRVVVWGVNTNRTPTLNRSCGSPGFSGATATSSVILAGLPSPPGAGVTPNEAGSRSGPPSASGRQWSPASRPSEAATETVTAREGGASLASSTTTTVAGVTHDAAPDSNAASIANRATRWSAVFTPPVRILDSRVTPPAPKFAGPRGRAPRAIHRTARPPGAFARRRPLERAGSIVRAHPRAPKGQDRPFSRSCDSEGDDRRRDVALPWRHTCCTVCLQRTVADDPISRRRSLATCGAKSAPAHGTLCSCRAPVIRLCDSHRNTWVHGR